MHFDLRVVGCGLAISERRTENLKRVGMTNRAKEILLACLDANVFLALLIPESTKALRAEIEGAERVLRAIENGRLRAVSPSILFGELRYVYLREDKPGFEVARTAIEAAHNFNTVPVTVPLAIQAAELRRKYYSKRNAFSYNDGLYLAVGLAEQADLLVTTDPHLLGIQEMNTMLPSQYKL
jgi:predicted nucleic acid-binding protein